MEIKLKVGGAEVSITVGTPQEAAALLSLIASQNPTSSPKPPSATQAIAPLPVEAKNPPARFNLDDLDLDSVQKPPALKSNITDSQILDALRRMQGNASAKVLKAIVDSGDGIFDVKIREAAGISAESGLGPIFSHISKCCISEGITRDALLIRRSKRGRKGKVHFHYRATDQAARLVNSIPDFATQQDSSELGDLDMLDL